MAAPQQEPLEKHLDEIFAFVAFRLVPDRDAAMDVVQDVFQSALASSNELRDPGAQRTWLFSIARRKLIDHFRRRRLESLDELQMIEQASEAGELTERTLRASLALRRLDAAQVRLLEGKYVEGESVRALAKREGTSEKATESALTRARNAFRREFSILDTRAKNL